MTLRSSRHTRDGDSPFWGRRVIVWSLLMVGLGIVLIRLFQLQVLNAQEMVDRARRQHQKTVVLESSRGTILDTRGRVLAMNTAVPSVFATPALIQNPRSLARSLAGILGISRSDIEKMLRKDRDFVWVKRKVSPEKLKQIDGLASQGVGVLMEEQRFYPKGQLLSHVLGFAGIDSQGLEGLETHYEPYLRGTEKRVYFHRDALGRVIIPKEANGEAPHLSGHTITLTIDEVVQYIAEKELEQAVTETSARGGTVLVMDPQTGGILAWALRPAFNPNNPHGTPADYWRNRAVTDPYEPGSTLKVALAAAALEEQEVEPGTLIYAGDGEMPVSGTVIHDHEKAGWVTFAQAVQQSSNVAAVKISLSLGKERLYRYLKAFGFGERTEVDLPGESVGLLKDTEAWGKRTMASIAIGQEIAVTPLQLLTAVSAIANQGWLMKPFLVKEIRKADGEMVQSRTGEVRRRPISAKTAKILTDLLVNVVNQGTGRQAAVTGFRVAGKTGTAQKIDHTTGKYSTQRFVGSFVGFVPADNPRIVTLVVIDEPKGPAWGGVVAAPVFRRIAEQVLRHLEIPPEVKPEPVTVAAVER